MSGNTSVVLYRPTPISSTFTLLLSTYLHLRLQSSLFFSRPSTNIWCALLIFHTYPAYHNHRIPFYFNNTEIFIKNTNSVKPCNFLQPSSNLLPLKSTHSNHHHHHHHRRRHRRPRCHRYETPKIVNIYIYIYITLLG